MTFFYHYNKPMTQRRGVPIISLHYGGACHFVRNIVIRVPTHGRVQSKRSPRFVVAGKANRITIRRGVATIQ